MIAGRELDALDAENVMGWVVFEGQLVHPNVPDNFRRWREENPSSEFKVPDLFPTPFYSTDIAAAWEMEQQIIKLELGANYAQELADIVNANPDQGSGPILYDSFEIVKIIKATPAQRCLAALKAVGVEV